MWYKIQPFDTLFFRDGRPFTMGMKGETWAKNIFPPNPSTIYGAIRSWLIFEKGTLEDFKKGKFNEELGNPQIKGTLQIKGPFLAKENLYFPAPLDRYTTKTKKQNHLFAIDFIEKPTIVISDYSLKNMMMNQIGENIEEAKGYLDIFSLKDYLENKTYKIQYRENHEFYLIEKKTGIKRNKSTLNAEEGYLYRIPMIRPNKKVYFYVEVDGLKEYPIQGIVRLGGEGKVVEIEKIQGQPFDLLKEIPFELHNRQFKIYLGTPAIFEQGWLPKWIDPKTYEGIYNDIKLKLIACSLGKSIQIGGWDLASQKPKPMYRAVPAGSVYYFEVLEKTDPEKILTHFHLKNISDVYPEEGYGFSLVGVVK